MSDEQTTVADLRRLAAVDRQDAVRTLAREEARRPFDPARGPLFRAGLWRLGDREHVLWVVALLMAASTFCRSASLSPITVSHVKRT